MWVNFLVLADVIGRALRRTPEMRQSQFCTLHSTAASRMTYLVDMAYRSLHVTLDDWAKPIGLMQSPVGFGLCNRDCTEAYVSSQAVTILR